MKSPLVWYTYYNFDVQDLWDSIDNNDYFSLEGLVDVFKQVACVICFLGTNRASVELIVSYRLTLLFSQLRVYKTPDLESPKYQILKRTANYEVTYLPCLLKLYWLSAPICTNCSCKGQM